MFEYFVIYYFFVCKICPVKSQIICLSLWKHCTTNSVIFVTLAFTKLKLNRCIVSSVQDICIVCILSLGREDLLLREMYLDSEVFLEAPCSAARRQWELSVSLSSLCPSRPDKTPMWPGGRYILSVALLPSYSLRITTFFF